MGALFGRPMVYKQGGGLEKSGKWMKGYIEFAEATENGMVKNGDKYEYGNREGDNKFIESGYTIVMEMLGALNTQNENNNETQTNFFLKKMLV